MGNCVYKMYGLFGFAENLNIQNYMNSTRNSLHWMYELNGFVENLNSADKMNIQNCMNLIGYFVH